MTNTQKRRSIDGSAKLAFLWENAERVFVLLLEYMGCLKILMKLNCSIVLQKISSFPTLP